MDPHPHLVVLFAVFFLLFVGNPVRGTPPTTVVPAVTGYITGDVTFDDSGSRKIQITFETYTTQQTILSGFSMTSSISSAISQVLNQDTTLRSTNCPTSSDPCNQSWDQVFTIDPEVLCDLGTTSFTYQWTVACNTNCSDGNNHFAPGTNTGTLSVDLWHHDICASSQVSMSANVSSFGAYGDATFSQSKSLFYVNDVAYFPFQLGYSDISISSLTFNTIVVDPGTGPISLLDPSSSVATNTGAGNAVQLKTYPVTTTVNPGKTATAWFSLVFTRSSGSPFADTPYISTPYTFTVVFDVSYRNSKRSLSEEVTQIRGHSTVYFVTAKEGQKVVRQSQQQKPKQASSAVHSASFGMSISLCGIFILFLSGILF